MIIILICSLIASLFYSSHAGPIFYATNVLPEAMRYYEDYGFLTGSMAFGTIFQYDVDSTSNNYMNPMNFTATSFYSNENLTFSTGLGIDTERSVLFICHSDPNTFSSAAAWDPSPANFSDEYDFMSGVMIVDLMTNEVLADFDFADYNVDSDNPMYHLSNDLVFDSDGNAFVTDSFGGAVYKITLIDDMNNASYSYSMELFSYTPSWQIPGSFFFDGIEIDRKNESFLLINCWLGGFGGDSVIYKIQMDDPMNPKIVNYTNVASIQYGFDGQVFSEDGEYFYVVGDITNTIYQFTSSDNWDTMTLVQSLPTSFNSPSAIQIATYGPYGTGISDTIYASSGLLYTASKFPIELIDFTRNSTIYINNTCAFYTTDADEDGSDTTDDDVVIYSLGAVCALLVIALIIAFICICKLKKSIAYHGSNLDYQNLQM